MQLAAGSALLIGLGSAGGAHAAVPRVTCEAHVTQPWRTGSNVTTTHTITCNTYVSSISLSASLDSPSGAYVSDQQTCFSCDSLSVQLALPFDVSGVWGAEVYGSGSDWGEDAHIATGGSTSRTNHRAADPQS